ncbi:M3 family metallopeptidase [Hyphomonas sp. WL0036]|uniref:M3 family metallopeptidase n=1 Tax=Hyphomonas sediminis TaxID=2866160 RepID=UPI001C80BDF7|nr:M3 family metallopeptidase [Hyphomonas sediminis]MBY9066283.1 M3 family metallopeptidase [Hyphomonas sediminis]
MTEALKGGAAALVLAATAACGAPEAAKPESEVTSQIELPEITVSDAELEGNPFRAEWTGEYGVPPFAEIKNEHYMPAVKKGILEMRAEIDAIVNNPEEPTFENTILAMEASGKSLDKAVRVFGNITNTDTNDALNALEGEIYPMLTREQDAITFNPKLFARVQAVYDQKDRLGLDEQDARLLELTHRNFVRAGANLSPDVQAEVAKLNAEISGLTTEYGQNLLNATNAFKLEINDAARLGGLSDDFKNAIKVDGEDKWRVGISRSFFEGFMSSAEDRDLRSQLFDGYRLVASSGEYDNGPLAIKLAQLRAKRAELMGYKSHAHYVLEQRMAHTPEAAVEFLEKVLKPALERAAEEQADMEKIAGHEILGHDWWFYSEKVRADRYAFDENQLRPYFELGASTEGAFEVASRLFNISFKEVPVDGWNPVVKSYEVTDNATGEHLGLLMIDNFARETKRGGAWMSTYQSASDVDGERIRPIITNNMNLVTPAAGQPALLSPTEVETLFHEFGHGLHGLLTQIRYASFSGVYGGPDYVELPSQIMEHWVTEPQVLAMYAKHYETGAPLPQDLVDKMNKASTFNQGFKTTEYIAASLIDLHWHMLSSEEAAKITDARAFEKSVLEKYGIPEIIEPRYRSTYFSHIFAGGYAAGYYAYLWAEILDADGFDAFKQTGDIFNPEVAAKLKQWVFESGGLRETDELYRNFRGSDPGIEPLLRNRGFAEPSPAEG